MKTLIADRFSESARARLSEADVAVDYRPDLASDELAEAVAVADADVLVVRSTRVDPDMSGMAAGRLRLVIRAGAGFNMIDPDESGPPNWESESPTVPAGTPTRRG